MDTLQVIWNYVVPIGGGITIGAIIAFIVTLVVKSFVNRLVGKLNIEKVEEKAVAKGVEKVKEISFKQSIEPIAKSELKKITEEANSYIYKTNEEIHEEVQKIIKILAKFSMYFDDSISISAEKKLALKEEIENALDNGKVEEVAQEIVLQEIIHEIPKEEFVEEKKSTRVSR